MTDEEKKKEEMSEEEDEESKKKEEKTDNAIEQAAQMAGENQALKTQISQINAEIETLKAQNAVLVESLGKYESAARETVVKEIHAILPKYDPKNMSLADLQVVANAVKDTYNAALKKNAEAQLATTKTTPRPDPVETVKHGVISSRDRALNVLDAKTK